MSSLDVTRGWFWRRGLEHKLATLDGALVRSLTGLHGLLALASDEVEIKVWFSAT